MGYQQSPNDEDSRDRAGKDCMKGNCLRDQAFSYQDPTRGNFTVSGADLRRATIALRRGLFTLGQGQFGSKMTLLGDPTLDQKNTVNNLHANPGRYCCLVAGVSGTGLGRVFVDGHIGNVAGSSCRQATKANPELNSSAKGFGGPFSRPLSNEGRRKQTR